MSSSININSVLSNIAKNYDASKANKNSSSSSSSSSNYDSSIFQKATELVAAYKEKQNSSSTDTSSSSSSSSFIGGLSFTEVANMSTSDFLKYAYENKSSSGFKESDSTDSSDDSDTDTSGVDLPMLVRYKGEVFSTAGKSFMAVVAKIHAKYPRRSEEEIAAELMTKYGSSSTDSSSKSSSSKTTGSTLNLSA